MGIKEKLMGKDSSIYSGKPKEEFPDDFQENTEAIKESEDRDIAEFIRRKKGEKEEKAKPLKEELEKVEEPVKPDPTPEPVKDKSPVETMQPVEEEKVSNLAKILTIYMTPDKVDATKEALKSSLDANYMLGLQAGIQVTKENVEEINSILRYLADNKWLVVVSGEQVEPLFNEPTK